MDSIVIPSIDTFLSPEYQLLKYGYILTDKDLLVKFTEIHLEEFSEHYAYAPDGLWQAYAYQHFK